MTPFYWIFNQFIFKESYEKVKEIGNGLFEALGFLMLNCQINKKKMQGNLPLAHTLLLLEHYLMVHSTGIVQDNPEFIYSVFKKCKDFLPIDKY